MPTCSYCSRAVSEHEECFSWTAARGCGISGPDDPKRLEGIIWYSTNRAARLEREAADVVAAADMKAARLRQEATSLRRDADEARAKAAGIPVKEA